MIIITTIIVIGNVHAQKMPAGLQGTPKIIQGKYVNPDFGLELTFPDGMVGGENRNTEGLSLLMAGGPLDPSAQILVAMFNSTGVQSQNNTATLLNMMAAEPRNCLFGSMTVNLNGKDFRVSDDPCIILGASMKMKNSYTSIGDGTSMILIRLQTLTIPTESAYQSSLPIFEKLMNSENNEIACEYLFKNGHETAHFQLFSIV
jgi:hypothetical protein